jgi:hypothetical protein
MCGTRTWTDRQSCQGCSMKRRRPSRISQGAGATERRALAREAADLSLRLLRLARELGEEERRGPETREHRGAAA